MRICSNYYPEIRTFAPHNHWENHMKIQIVNKSKHPLPAYATPLSAGMDIRANLAEPVTLHPLEHGLIPTGLFIALPEGYEAQMRPRSGLALKHGITLLNTPGTIDADYRATTSPSTTEKESPKWSSQNTSRPHGKKPANWTTQKEAQAASATQATVKP